MATKKFCNLFSLFLFLQKGYDQQLAPKPQRKRKEIEIGTKATLSEHHTQYVDLCQWNPKSDLFLTAAATDKKTLLWNCQDFKDVDSISVTTLDLSDPVSCIDWAESGKLFILGKMMH